MLGRAEQALRRTAPDDEPSYVIQLLVEADGPLSPAAEAQARAFFDQAVRALRRLASGGPDDVRRAG